MKDEIKEFNEEKYVEMLEDGTLYDFIINLQEKSNNQAEEINRLYKQREKFMKKYGYLKEENERLKKDLKTLWNVCWNNDTEMTSYQNEVFDNYYDIFHKNGGDEE